MKTQASGYHFPLSDSSQLRGYALGQISLGEQLHRELPPVPIIADVSSSAYKPRLLRCVPHRCPVSRWRTHQPTMWERLSLFLRTVVLPNSRTTFIYAAPRAGQYHCPPTSPHAFYALGLEREGEGRGGHHRHLEKPQASILLLPSFLAEPWSYTVD